MLTSDLHDTDAAAGRAKLLSDLGASVRDLSSAILKIADDRKLFDGIDRDKSDNVPFYSPRKDDTYKANDPFTLTGMASPYNTTVTIIITPIPNPNNVQTAVSAVSGHNLVWQTDVTLDVGDYKMVASAKGYNPTTVSPVHIVNNPPITIGTTVGSISAFPGYVQVQGTGKIEPGDSVVHGHYIINPSAGYQFAETQTIRTGNSDTYDVLYSALPMDSYPLRTFVSQRHQGDDDCVTSKCAIVPTN